MLLILPLTAALGSIAMAADSPNPAHDLGLKALEAPEKSISESGFEYFALANDVYSLTNGDWNRWGQDHWIEWSLGRHMWGYDGNTLHFGTNTSVYYYWDGEFWDAYGLPSASFGGSVVGFARDDVYTVGRNSVESFLYRWVEQGELRRWEIVRSLGSYQLTEMWGLAGDNLFFGGFDGALLNYDGSTVHQLSFQNFGRISSLWGTSAGNIYGIADGTGLVHYNGEVLAPVTLPDGFPTTALRRVWGSGPNDVWAVGVGGSIVHFDGTEWTNHQIEGASPQFESVYGSGPSDVWAVGLAGAGYHYDGTAWTKSLDMEGIGVNYLGVWGSYRSNGDEHWDSRFGSPFDGGMGFDQALRAVRVHDNDILAGGNFRNAGPDTANYMARFNGTSWTPMYNSTGPNGEIRDFIEYDGDLIVCGSFSQIDGDTITAVARWDGSAWVQLGEGMLDVVRGNSYFTGRMVIWDGKLVVVGVPAVNQMWDGTEWTLLPGADGNLYDAVVYDGDLFAGGGTSVPAPGLLRYNGTTWEQVGNTPFNGAIYALEVYDNSLFFGGSFSMPDLGYDHLARWSGVSYGTVGAFLGSYVTDLNVYRDELFAGGIFSGIDGADFNGAALWNSADGWRPMGSGINSWTWSSVVHNDALWMGGALSYAGNRAAARIARWQEEIAVPAGPPATAGEPAEPGQDFAIRLAITGNPGDEPILAHYRLRDGEPYQVARMYQTAAKDGLFEGTIPGNFFGDLGFQYYVTGGSEGSEFTFPAGDPDEPLYQPAWTGVTMSNFSFTTPSAQTYTMMGIPFVPGSSANAILTGGMGAYDRSQWRFGRWDPANNRYQEFPSTPEFAPGLGYWLIQRSPRTIPVNGTSTSTFGGVTIALKPGWNMISTPYNFTIAWNSVARGPNVENRLVARSGGSYVDVTSMNPWQGYWVNNTSLNDEMINIPPTQVIVMKDAPVEAPEALEFDWTLTIGAVKGDRSDPQNYAAVGAAAEAGIDAQDFHEPPAMPGDVSLHFEVAEGDRIHTLSRDVRAAFSDGEAWDAVLKVEGGGRVNLNFAGAADVPEEFGVVLITETGQIDLRTTEATSVVVGPNGEMRMRLAVGEPQFVAEQEQNLPRPFALRGNYPNPFNPRTKVSFTLPRQANVLIEIFDIRGRKVRTLADDSFEPGLHELDWLGQDDSGRSVSTGVYFSQMRADGFVQTRKMTLVR